MTQGQLSQTGLHCPRCTFELAHLKVAPNGTVRQLLRTLLAPGERLQGRYRVSGVLDHGGRGHPGLLTCARA